MSETKNTKQYDLEDRTLEYAKKISIYIRHLPKSICNFEHSKQLVRAAGSIGANYIEANEALSKKDFLMRLRISRKEAKETRYWLRLTEPDSLYSKSRDALIQEATELMNIFGSIIRKSE